MEHTLKRLLLFLSLSAAVWAGIGQCSSTATSLSSYVSNGCYVADLNFTNIAITSSVQGSPAPSAPTLSQIDLQSILGTSTAQAIQLSSPTSGLACAPGTTLWCANQGGYIFSETCSYQVGTDCGTFYQPGFLNSQTSFTATVNQDAASPPAGSYYAITQLAISASGIQNTGGYYQGTYYYDEAGEGYISENYTDESYLEYGELYCVGVSSSSGCTGANEGEIYLYFENGPSGAFSGSAVYGPGDVYLGAGNSVSFAGPGYTQIYIQDFIDLDWVGSGAVSVGTISNTFGESLETLEPSTFSLLAAGLGAAALIMVFRSMIFLHFTKRNNTI